MAQEHIDIHTLRAVIALLPDPFYTKDVSNHPMMLKAHAELTQHSHYHAIVGLHISEHITDAKQIGTHHRKGAQWTMGRGAGRPTPAKPKPARAIRQGHWHAVEMIEQGDGYAATLELYARWLGPNRVYLRPVDGEFTVVSLECDRCAKMIGVGRDGTSQHRLGKLPPTEEQVRAAIEGYIEKREQVRDDAKPEERFSQRLVAHALQSGLVLPIEPLHFVCQEWRLPTLDQGLRLDILALHLQTSKLVVIELKSSRSAAQQTDRNGRDAADQAAYYGRLLYEHREELYPFFQRLARAMGMRHGAPQAMCNLELDPDHRPTTRVWTPESLH